MKHQELPRQWVSGLYGLVRLRKVNKGGLFCIQYYDMTNSLRYEVKNKTEAEATASAISLINELDR